jgi:hypothetical protein
VVVLYRFVVVVGVNFFDLFLVLDCMGWEVGVFFVGDA